MRVDTFDDRMIVQVRGGSSMHGAQIETYQDHRMAMSMAVAGLRIQGVNIKDEQCYGKIVSRFLAAFQLCLSHSD